jgi:hypothetical protein
VLMPKLLKSTLLIPEAASLKTVWNYFEPGFTTKGAWD